MSLARIPCGFLWRLLVKNPLLRCFLAMGLLHFWSIFTSLIKKLLFCLDLEDCVCQKKVPHKLIKDYFLLCLAFLSNNASFFFFFPQSSCMTFSVKLCWGGGWGSQNKTTTISSSEVYLWLSAVHHNAVPVSYFLSSSVRQDYTQSSPQPPSCDVLASLLCIVFWQLLEAIREMCIRHFKLLSWQMFIWSGFWFLRKFQGGVD